MSDKESDLRVTYHLSASLGGDVSTKDQPKFKPLVNKRLLIISSPQKINFNLKVVNDFESKSVLFIKHGQSQISGMIERDSYQPNQAINLRLTFDNTKGN